MRGGAPPDIQNAQLVQNTNAAPNTNTTTQILAPPGAGRRYRIWAYQFGWTTSAIAAGVVGKSLIRSNPGITNRIDTFISRDGAGNQLHTIPGGMTCNNNAAVDVIEQASAASQGIMHRVWYTVEEV